MSTPPLQKDWEEWQSHPATAWFFAFLRAEAKRSFDAFALRAWAKCPSPEDHAKMRERAETLSWLARARLSDFTAAADSQTALSEALAKMKE